MKSYRLYARMLRQRGFTYREIQQHLAQPIPKSTLSNWCTDIALTVEQQQRITRQSMANLATARTAATQSRIAHQKEQATSISHKSAQLVNRLDHRDALLALAMLYLGEGYKYPSYAGLRLGSSDPLIVKLYVRLLAVCYGKTPADLKCIISYRSDQDFDTLITYWSGISTIPIANFYRSKPDPRTARKPTKNQSYMGVATISCSGASEQRALAAIAKAFLSADYRPQ